MMANQFSLNVLAIDETFYQRVTEIVKNAMKEYQAENLNGPESVQKIKNRVSLKKACQYCNIGYSTALAWKKKGWVRSYGTKRGSFVFLNEFREDVLTIQKNFAS